MWFGDSLDGTLARVRKRQRPRYGFYVDHVSDTFGGLFLTSGLAFSGYMSTAIAAGLLVVFFMLFIQGYFAPHKNWAVYLSFLVFCSTPLCLRLAIRKPLL